MRVGATLNTARLFLLVLFASAVLFAKSAFGDTLSELYGTVYDRTSVIEAGMQEGQSADTLDEIGIDEQSLSCESDTDSGIALYSTQTASKSVSPRYISSEMLYFCKWESGQNYNHGLSSGDGYHALGYFQFDNRYDLGPFLKAVYNYNPKKYAALSVIGTRYSWNVTGATRDGDSFTQLGDDLNRTWHAAYSADPSEFSALQNDWAYTQYYDGSTGIRGSLRAMGIDIDDRSDSVKSLVWGMSNLFGQGGGGYYVANGFYYGANWFIKNSGVNESMDDAAFVSVLCDFVINNIAKRYSSQPEYWQGWQNRYRDEKSHYLSQIQHWVNENGTWYLENAANGEKSKGWADVRNSWYYLDPCSGAMQTGWVFIDGSWYWFDASGAMKTGWLNLNGIWYYLGSSGAMLTAWQPLNGAWYWFDTSSGAMATSRSLCNGYWSDFASSGEWEGYTNGWDERDGSWYWLANGLRVSGWQYINGNWYWLNNQNNKAAQDSVLKIGSSTYAFDSSCRMDQNEWGLVDGSWYWATPSGELSSGWQNIDGRWYWLDQTTCVMQTGWQLINGSWYHLSPSGMMDSGWLHDRDCWFLLDNLSGFMLTGWQQINNVWYYLDSQEGIMQTGWQLIDNCWYFFDTSGAMQRSEWVGNYYLLGSGKMAKNQWIDSYYVDENGCWSPSTTK